MILIYVFFLSLSSLAFEVLLARVFSISQWNHLSFMVISIALFGFAASGTFLNIMETRKEGFGIFLASGGRLKILIVLFSVVSVFSFMVLNNIPLDYFKLPFEPSQAIYLLTAYILLSLPFFFTGTVLSLAYSFWPGKSGIVYFSSMAGSACGAVIPMLLLPLFGEGKLVIIAALFPLLLVPLREQPGPCAKPPARHQLRGNHSFFFLICFCLVFFTVVSLLSRNENVFGIKPSSYKYLSHFLKYPDTRIVETHWGMRGKIDRLTSPYIRFSPGLSLKFTGELPVQQAVCTDGDNPFFLYDPGSEEKERFSMFTLSYAGYLLIPTPGRVLVIQNGGGLAIPCAVAADAKDITIVEQNPDIANIIRNHYRLPVVNDNPRSFLIRSPLSFDVVHVENWGSSAFGSAALDQDYSFTEEAVAEYYNHLSEAGVLILSRKLLLPPANSLRLWATAYRSLASTGLKNPERHIIVLRNWDTFTLIIFKQAAKNMDAIESFAKHRNFDIVYISDIEKKKVNLFSVFDKPYYFLEIDRLNSAYGSGKPVRYFQRYPLDVAPQTDDRPFPNRFLQWSTLRTAYQSMGSRLYSLLLSGELIVGAVLVVAILVGVLLLVLPLLFLSIRRKNTSVRQIFYFLSVGAGFIFVELFFIKEYTLIFGDPVISFTFVLSGILVFSGVGGLLSNHLNRRGLQGALIALIAVLFCLWFGIESLIQHMLKFSRVSGHIICMALLFPAGFLMGLPFPIGMRSLLKNPSQRAYGWSANGCASVVSSIISAQLALSYGIRTILVCAILSYAIVLLCASKD